MAPYISWETIEKKIQKKKYIFSGACLRHEKIKLDKKRNAVANCSSSPSDAATDSWLPLFCSTRGRSFYSRFYRCVFCATKKKRNLLKCTIQSFQKILLWSNPRPLLGEKAIASFNLSTIFFWTKKRWEVESGSQFFCFFFSLFQCCFTASPFSTTKSKHISLRFFIYLLSHLSCLYFFSF